MNYYQHHIGDYRRDTAHLTLLEHGAYRQLLDLYYLSESRIPDETESVYRRLCARTDEEKKAVDTVLSEFFRRDEGWLHGRCEKVIAEYKEKADRARDNGKLGGRPSKTKEVISGNPDVTQTKANHKPLTINQEPVTKNQEPKSIKEQDQKQGATRPDWLNKEDWESFKKHRGSKFTTRAQEMMVKQLSTYRDQGQDPNAMLQRSIANGWKGVFAEKQGTNNGTGYISERDKARKRTAKGLYGYDPDAIAGVSTRID